MTRHDATDPLPQRADYLPHTRRRRVVLGVLCVGLALVVLMNIWLGAPGVQNVVGPRLVFNDLAEHIPLLDRLSPAVPRFVDSIIWQERIPRALGGAIVGMLLALAGVAFQSLLMNPLADPYIVGVSAGSALGSVGVILIGGATALAGFAQPLAGFCTGLATTLAVYLLSRRSGRVSAQAFLLGGIVVGTFVWSVIQLILAVAIRGRDPGAASHIVSQLLGNLQFVDWRSFTALVPFAVVGGSILWTAWRELNIMSTGEESAAHLGVDTEAFKRRVIIAGSLVTAAAVSVAGIIAFVGLIVPHIGRRLLGSPDHRVLLPVAMLLGGLMLELSDLISRVALNELEVGVVTAVIGAPVFCYLLRTRMQTRWS